MFEFLKYNKKGFTVIELLVVIAIIALLSSVILVATRSSKEKATYAKVLQYSASVKNFLGAYIIGEWNFNEGSGTIVVDSSGYGNNGTISSAFFTTDTIHKLVGTGSGGYALNFDGVEDGEVLLSSVRISENVSLNGLFAKFTVTAWIKPLGWIGTYMTIVGFGNSTTIKTHYDITNNGKLYVSWINEAGTSQNLTGITTLNLNNWYFVTFTYNDNKGGAYLNGVLDKEITVTGKLDTRFGTYIGIRQAGAFIPLNPFDGLIDEVRIYNEFLSLTQIQKLYAEGARRHKIVIDK